MHGVFQFEINPEIILVAGNIFSSPPFWKMIILREVTLLSFGHIDLISIAQTDVTRWCRMTFWPRYSNFVSKVNWLIFACLLNRHFVSQAFQGLEFCISNSILLNYVAINFGSLSHWELSSLNFLQKPQVTYFQLTVLLTLWMKSFLKSGSSWEK